MEHRLQTMRLSGRSGDTLEDSDLIFAQKVFLTRLWTLGYDSPDVTKKIYQMSQTIWGPFENDLQIRKFAPLRYGQKLGIPALAHTSTFKSQWVGEEFQVRMSVEPSFKLIELTFDRWLIPWKILGAYDEQENILFLSEAPEGGPSSLRQHMGRDRLDTLEEVTP